ncbi:hypothetical protein Bca52824_080844 [Brassica carinata]|uniref:Uncharacterized protein n=1 Tax=Brassica carinata TaxID=52824 RepID=A0A8X7PGU9_BRACI|nr:hypothetical protein Bca52824_080844 [Brassica carinata]
MFSRRWDPGIGEEVWIGIGNHQDKIHGDTEKRFLPDLGRFEVMRGKGELGTLRKIRIIAKLISISVIIKTKFPDNKGRINHGSGFIGGMENWDPLWNWSLEMAFIIVSVIYSGVFILYGMCGKAQTKLVYSYFDYRADQVLRQEWTSNVVIMEWRIRLQRYVLFFWSKWENGVFIGAADAMAAFGVFKPNTV